MTWDFDKLETWGAAIVATPVMTFDFLFGSQDGEFYDEGHLLFVALGWWTLLWAVLVLEDVISFRFGDGTPAPPT